MNSTTRNQPLDHIKQKLLECVHEMNMQKRAPVWTDSDETQWLAAWGAVPGNYDTVDTPSDKSV